MRLHGVPDLDGEAHIQNLAVPVADLVTAAVVGEGFGLRLRRSLISAFS